MATQEAPTWIYDQTGTVDELVADLDRQNFDGNKRALATKNLAIELLNDLTYNGARVQMKEYFTDTGHRNIAFTVTEIPLLLVGGEAERRARGREMRP